MLRNTLSILVLLIFIIFYFKKFIPGDGIFFAGGPGPDSTDFSYPYKKFYSDNLNGGFNLFWNPHIGMGVPVLAETQTGVFHPINQILFRIFPLSQAYNLRIIMSFCLLSITTYFYCKTLNISSSSSVFASISITFSGFMIARILHLPILNAIELFPLSLIAIENIIKSGNKLFYALILAISLSLSLLAGHTSTSYTIYLMVFFYFLIRVIFLNSYHKYSIKIFYYLLFATIWSIILSAVQIVPTLELVPFSTRAQISLTKALPVSFDYRFLLTFVNPYLFGDPSRGYLSFPDQYYLFAEYLGYIGLIPLLIIVIGIITKSISGYKPLIFLAVFSYLLLLGDLGLYVVFYYLFPGFSLIRIPGRFLFYLDFSLVVISALTVDKINYFKHLKTKSIFISIVILIAFLDLYIFGHDYNSKFSVPTSLSQYPLNTIASDKNLFRYTTSDSTQTLIAAYTHARGWRNNLNIYLDQWVYLSPDRNILYKISSTKNIYQSEGHFLPQRPVQFDELSARLAENNNFKLLSLQNVKYLIRAAPASDQPDLRLIYAGQKGIFPLYIYQNLKYLPRAFLINQYQILNPEDILDYMSSDKFNPENEVILEAPPDYTYDNTPNSSDNSQISISDYQNAYVVLSADIENPKLLILTDNWYPGWKAYINGNETKIYRANYTFRAIELPSGQHRIEFKFVPTYWWISLSVTLISTAVTFVMFILNILRSFKK